MKNKKKALLFLGCTVMWMMCSASAAALRGEGAIAEIASERSEPKNDEGVVFYELSDELHTKTAILESLGAVHYYSFKALRGQRVLLAIPAMREGSVFWDVEYLEEGQWKALQSASKIFSGDGTHNELKVRVMHKKDLALAVQPYSVIMGSLPVLVKYELEDQHGVNRIPMGYTSPPFLMTQGYTYAFLEAHFTDSKGHPLKGASGVFELDLKESRIPKIVEQVTSNEAGRISKMISFGPCHGGRESGEIKHYYGAGVWRSYYYVGSYTFRSQTFDPALAGAVSSKIRTFGHICKHRKVGR